MRLVANRVSVTLGGRPVLHEASLALAPGEVVGLLGPNGAGKSTLMRALARLVAHGGTVHLGERSTAEFSAGELAKLLAFLPQTRAVAWSLSVRNLVRLGRLPWRGSFARGMSARDEEIVADAMALMDVAHLAERPATELSGGEQARVLVARAVAQDTPFLIADEPASGLDPAHQMTMMQAFGRRASQGRAILVSLHDLTLAARWCDRILLMKDGRIAVAGTPDEILTAERLQQVFGISAHIARDAEGLIVAPVALA